MKKEYAIVGLLFLSAVAVAYARKPKKNSEGFFNAIGGGAQDTRPDYGFFANVNGVCTLFVHGVNADTTKAYYKAPSNGKDIYALTPIKGNEYYLATKLPRCFVK